LFDIAEVTHYRWTCFAAVSAAPLPVAARALPLLDTIDWPVPHFGGTA